MQSINLNTAIGDFYDRTTDLWEKYWGDHLHHGYYELGEDYRYKDRHQAQVDLLTKLIEFSQLEKVNYFLDVGCGIGGSSLWLVQKFGAQGVGITLSTYQQKRATIKAKQAGLQDKLTFVVADALAMPFPQGTFDLVWSLESGEHMANKGQFLAECARVLQPQGQLVLATWCHRGNARLPLTSREQQLLQRIYDIYCLPYIISLDEYVELAKTVGLEVMNYGDWSAYTAPFWHAVWDSAWQWNALREIFLTGLTAVGAALAVRLMIRAYEMGLCQFGVLTARKL